MASAEDAQSAALPWLWTAFTVLLAMQAHLELDLLHQTMVASVLIQSTLLPGRTSLRRCKLTHLLR